MAATIDKKLYRVVLSARSDRFKTELDVAKHIESQKAEEFKYVRNGEERICSASTIRAYVIFAKEIKLLSESLDPMIDKTQIVNTTNFNNWVADSLLAFAKENRFELSELKRVVTDLVKTQDELPTSQNIYKQLGLKISVKSFYWCLCLLFLLRPATLTIFRKWLWIPAETIKI